MTPPGLHRLREFALEIDDLVSALKAEPVILQEGGLLLKRLIAEDDWLPDAFAVPDVAGYRQYLLYCDPRERFSIVSFVWGPGQKTPIHNHMVWGLVGVLRGSEISQRYGFADGRFGALGEPHRLEAGDIEPLTSAEDDLHWVSNAHAGRTSISVHVYGGNIGAVRRSSFSENGEPKDFISGYSSNVVPNLWDRPQQGPACLK